MHWASALSERTHSPDALSAAADQLDEGLSGNRPDLLFLFASPHHGEAWPALLEKLAARYSSARILGCSGGGVIGGEREVERVPALSLLGASLPGVRLSPFRLTEATRPKEGAPTDLWREALDLSEGSPQLVLLSDPGSIDVEQLLGGLDAAFPAGVVVGGLASGGRARGANAVFLGDQVHRDGAVGVALSGDVVLETLVAQGCKPVGMPMFVTRASRNIVYQLDGMPALKVLESVYGTLAPPDQALFRQALFLGVVMREGSEVYRPGDFLVRNILGVDPDAGALAVAARPQEGSVVQFHVRDAKTSAADLEELLGRTAAPPAGALLFSCLGRGQGLYGKPNHDSDLFRSRMGKVAVGGFFCNGEIGPVHGKTFLHGYTSCFGLFRPKP